jgi:NAD(P)-dependent dehydrogenase (short-subunit alcohol dehydrogenase family)
MKIVVFGASRGVGLQVVEQALPAGHTITASESDGVPG